LPQAKIPCCCERRVCIEGVPTSLGASTASTAATTAAETSFILRDTIEYPEFMAPICRTKQSLFAAGRADAHIKSLRLGKSRFSENDKGRHSVTALSQYRI
jgi:hypothetical protein